MPPFANIIKGHEEAIIAYLFENKNKKLSQKESDLLEIQNNISAIQHDKNAGAKKDTAPAYLNLTQFPNLKELMDIQLLSHPGNT